VENAFIEKIRNDLLIGTLLTIPSPDVAEILVEAGFDWLFIDMEHGTFSVADVQRILQAVDRICPCVVRVPSGDESWIKRVLDTGPDGLIIPHVNTAEETERLVRLSLYPPEGARSAGISRARGYGLSKVNGQEGSGRTAVIIPQVEHITGVGNILSIVGVSGIGAVFVGPYDLSGSLAKLGQVDDPQVIKAVDAVAAACGEAGLPAGIFGIDAEAAATYMKMGYRLIAVGADTLFLGNSARETVERLR